MPVAVGALAKRFGSGLTVLHDDWGGGWSIGTVICAHPVEVVEAFHEPIEALEEAVAARPDCLWAGYISYDAGRSIEAIPQLAVDDVAVPLLRFCAYPAWVTLEGSQLKAHGEQGPAGELAAEVGTALKAGAEAAPPDGTAARFVERSFTRDKYETAVRDALEHIRAGDFYQVNLSQRFSARLPDPGALADAMTVACPSPYGAYIDAGEFQVISASPELFLSVDEGIVTSSPIKGTRPRSRIPEEDAHLAEELSLSEKDRAENLMIVDLIRNDLGKVCEPGSVEVDSLWGVESFATVHHLVSTITGRLVPGAGLKRLLEAAFPGGSITGAPKVAAMKFIEETEPFRRGIYTGSIGWIGPASKGMRLELNIAIRTVTYQSGCAHLHVGGGIVADSVPAFEYKETLDKAAGIAEAMGLDPNSL
ncbi:MAG: aminodeoxychorismate synthase component I [Acidobacteria bacterium]|nr:MAG: aminodeoxychorismate synthase component I [Acidobacteriota bacterium]